MRIGDLAAARRMVLRAHQLEAISLAQRLHPLDEQIAERERLAAHLGHVGFEDQVDTDLERREPEQRGRPAVTPLDSGGGVIIFLERAGLLDADPDQNGSEYGKRGTVTD